MLKGADINDHEWRATLDVTVPIEGKSKSDYQMPINSLDQLLLGALAASFPRWTFLFGFALLRRAGLR